MVRDLEMVFQAYLILLGIGLVAYPWLYKIFVKLPDRGWVMGKAGGSLALALVVWSLAIFRIPINTDIGVTLTVLLLTGLTLIFAGGQIKPALRHIKKRAGLFLIEEGLFLAGFAGYALVRGFQPDILGLEKFMDFGFIKSYLSSPTLPASDMWWAGMTINYYSFGHFWTSILIRTWGVADGVGYNLMLAFILGSSLALVFSVVVGLLDEDDKVTRRMTIAGIIGAMLVTLGGNSHTVWSWISKRSLSAYWYADATRFIRNTIHEFPGYSFVVSDLHGHVLSLPIVLMFILVLVNWWREGGLATPRTMGVVLGVLVGLMIMTNTWDAPIYLMLLAIFFGLELLAGRGGLAAQIKSGLIILTVALLTAGVWLAGFKSISNGVAVVTERSPVWQLAVLWAIHLIITVIALMAGALAKKKNLLVVALGITAITLLLIPEFIFVRDIYPSHPRANTMFKLTYQAFIMMGILFGWLVGKVSSGKYRVLRMGATIGLLVLFGGLMIFPRIGFNSYYANFKTYRGLDGLAFLKTRFSEDGEIIKYLNLNRDGKNMVEAVGDSYSETDFISALGGVPTIVGWRVHEWLWRGGYDPVAKREEEVRRFYEGASLAESKQVAAKYNLGWVVVTERERTKYKLNETVLGQLGKIVWQGKRSYLIKIK